MELVSLTELARRRGVSKATMSRHLKRGILPEHAYVFEEGNRHPLIKFELAMEVLDKCLDAGRVQEHAAKKVASKTNKAQPVKKVRGDSKGAPEPKSKKDGVDEAKTDQKPKEESQNLNPHDEQRRQAMLEGLVLDEASGLYLADDVEIEEIEGKRVVTAKDILLSNAERYQKSRALTESLKAQQLQIKLDVERGKLIDGDELRKKIFRVGIETRDALQNIPEQHGPDLLACQDLIELQSTLLRAINEALENLKRLDE